VWDGNNEGVTFEDGWRNKLIWGENLILLSSLTDSLAGKIRLIYIDPPFDSGLDYGFDISIGDTEFHKEPSIVEEVAYRDTWGAGRNSYLGMMYDRLTLMKDLLAIDAFIVVHVDWHVGHLMRSMLDEIFGADAFVNEIVWHYYNKYSAATAVFPRAHDNLYVYKKGNPGSINVIREDRDAPVKQLVRENIGGKLKNKRDSNGNLMYQEVSDKKVDDVWRIPALQPASGEWTGYQTQKHHDLLQRVILAFSNPGDLVADFFCGSGTTPVVAERLNRRWVACDLGRYAIHTTRKRLLEIDKCKPFELLNLGKYERQHWSSSHFGEDLDGDGQVNLLEYLAFVLKLYGAEALSGSVNLHGRQGNAYIHVGSVSSPVTISEIELAVNECKELGGSEVHILGWEWEMGLHDPITGRAKQMGVKLVLRQIPREIMESEAARKGQVKFFELAYLEAEITTTEKKNEYVCTLTDFSTPNLDLIPEEVREKVKKWSDYVDYWAVDWNYQNDTFNHGFVTYRTKQDRNLALESDPHDFDGPGKYQVMIKVIDIFGNDTSKIIEVTVPK
jgi:DNA modification methylase